MAEKSLQLPETASALAEQLKTQIKYDTEGMPPMEQGESVRMYMDRVVNLKVSDNADHLINKFLELADGVFLVDNFREGREIVYYKDKPDLKALEYLLNRVMGKPKETIEHEGGKKEGFVMMEEFIKKLANGETTTTRRVRAAVPIKGAEHV